MEIWIQEAAFDSPCATCGGTINKGMPITPQDEEAWRAGEPFAAVHVSCRMRYPRKPRKIVGVRGTVISVDPVLGGQHRFETPFEVVFGTPQTRQDDVLDNLETAARIAVSRALTGE